MDRLPRTLRQVVLDDFWSHAQDIARASDSAANHRLEIDRAARSLSALTGRPEIRPGGPSGAARAPSLVARNAPKSFLSLPDPVRGRTALANPETSSGTAPRGPATLSDTATLPPSSIGAMPGSSSMTSMPPVQAGAAHAFAAVSDEPDSTQFLSAGVPADQLLPTPLPAFAWPPAGPPTAKTMSWPRPQVGISILNVAGIIQTTVAKAEETISAAAKDQATAQTNRGAVNFQTQLRALGIR